MLWKGTSSMFNASRENPRVFAGLIEIAGYYGHLLHGLKEVGCKVEMVTITPHPFGYKEPPCGWTGAMVRWYFRRVFTHEEWPAFFPRWLRRLIGWITIWLAALQHDVFIFSYGLSFADDPLGPGLRPLRALGRKVIFIFNGSDSRATYCDRTGYHIGGEHTDAASLLRMIREKSEKLKRVHELADLVIDYPLSGHHHPRRYVDFIRLGIPTVVNAPESLPPPPGEGVPGRPVRILHCPSETGIKGSADVRRVMARLKRDGLDIEFIELRGVSNARVMEELRRTDIVVDQLYSDTPMAGFAREAAQLGRPVIVGGYAWKYLKHHLPEDEWPPSVLCAPDDLESCLRAFLAEGPRHWAAVGKRGYDFVRSRWTSRDCAERLLLALKAPEKCNLWVDPHACRYIWGCGMHALEILEVAQTIMRTAGAAGFRIDDKPELLALTTALGTMPLMDAASSDAFPELPHFDADTASVVRSLVERNVETSKRNAEAYDSNARLTAELAARSAALEAMENKHSALRHALRITDDPEQKSIPDQLIEAESKLENFRAMIQRRDRRIQKLEKKLGIDNSAAAAAAEPSEE